MLYTDEQIKKNVVDQLYWDRRVDAADIVVEVDNTNVTLKGKVPSYSERVAAYNAAWSVPGVASVDNEIAVDLPKTLTVPTDAEMQANIESLLLWSTDIPDPGKIDVSVTNGYVTLEGTVNSYWQKIRAEALASNITGVIDITNKLAVVPTEDVADEATAEDIVSALDRNALVNVDDVDVKVQNGIVTLSGTVPNWTAISAAHDMAAYTFGVINVQNDLVVEPAT